MFLAASQIQNSMQIGRSRSPANLRQSIPCPSMRVQRMLPMVPRWKVSWRLTSGPSRRTPHRPGCTVDGRLTKVFTSRIQPTFPPAQPFSCVIPNVLPLATFVCMLRKLVQQFRTYRVHVETLLSTASTHRSTLKIARHARHNGFVVGTGNCCRAFCMLRGCVLRVVHCGQVSLERKCGPSRSSRRNVSLRPTWLYAWHIGDWLLAYDGIWLILMQVPVIFSLEAAEHGLALVLKDYAYLTPLNSEGQVVPVPWLQLLCW